MDYEMTDYEAEYMYTADYDELAGVICPTDPQDALDCEACQ